MNSRFIWENKSVPANGTLTPQLTSRNSAAELIRGQIARGHLDKPAQLCRDCAIKAAFVEQQTVLELADLAKLRR